MLITRTDNRRMKRLEAKYQRLIKKWSHSHRTVFDIWGHLYPHMVYLKNQQSARIARRTGQDSFAGVPAAPHATRRFSFTARFGDLTDISKLELPYKERKERYLEEMKSNLNSWKGLPPLPHRGPRNKVSKSK